MEIDKFRYQSREVVLGGVIFRVKTPLSDEDLRRLTDFVDRKIQTALQGTRSGSYQSAAVLACLNMAEELFHLKVATEAHLKALEITAERALAELSDR